MTLHLKAASMQMYPQLLMHNIKEHKNWLIWAQ